MKNMENLPESIFDLIANKSFSELTVSEQEMVQAHISESDYAEYRSIVNDFMELDETMEVKPRNSNFAKTKESILRKILTYRIPVYQVAGLFLLMMAFAYLNFNPSNQTSEGQLTSTPSVLTSDKQNKIKSKVLDNKLKVVGEDKQISFDTLGKPLTRENYPEDLVFNL